MARGQTIWIDPDYPGGNEIHRIAWELSKGALILYPTDSVYAIGGHPAVRDAAVRLRALKPASRSTFLTLLAPSLKDIARYAHVGDEAFKLMKHLIPGPFTFIMQATKEVPRMLQNPKRKTIGIRVPDNPFCIELLKALDGPLISSSAPVDIDDPAVHKQELMDAMESRVEFLIEDGEPLRRTPSTVLDLTGPGFEVIRLGMGYEKLEPFLLNGSAI
jgi:tRNA threonylcarbamoyl adenosine modification protein (Sua5/YciO/YrdC/YwlC family)